MAAVEDRMWWYRSLHRHLLAVLAQRLGGGSARLLDAGCGTGGLLRRVVRELPSCEAVGLDTWPPACRRAATRSHRPIVQASVGALPFAAASFDAIVSADVLCHASAEPRRAVAEFWRCLRPRGIVAVNLPAYDWLASSHDARVMTTRRFTRGSLRALLEGAGFHVGVATYWNTLPFPLMVLRRRVFTPRDGRGDVQPYPGWLDASLGGLMAIEHALIRRGGSLCYGGSVLCVGEKRDDRGAGA